jgi:hypothetical protein
VKLEISIQQPPPVITLAICMNCEKKLQKQNQQGRCHTFRIPTLFTRLDEMNVATRPMIEHNPLKAPTMDGLIPVQN